MRIAHCSDLHLLSLAGSGLLDFANKRWIGGLNLLMNRGRHYHTHVFEAMVADFNAGAADHVLCTGDITNLALEEEFRFARSIFDRIELGPLNTTVLPGNHDAYVAEGAKHFLSHFDAFHESDDGFGSERWPLVRIRGDVAIVALSTSLQTPWFTAYGVIGQAQLDRLAEILSDPRLDNKMRLVAIHHPPAGPRALSRIRGLRDHEKFAEVLRKVGAELVLHGHEHKDLYEELSGPNGEPISVRGIQSGTYEAGVERLRARYRLYDVGDVGGSRPGVVADTLRCWNLESKSFEDEVTPVPDMAAAGA
jgi:3',5'-cyclic AMP phosphodiesterase CpdA